MVSKWKNKWNITNKDIETLEIDVDKEEVVRVLPSNGYHQTSTPL